MIQPAAKATPNDASGRSRIRSGGAVDQVAALVHQHVDLFAGWRRRRVSAAARPDERAVGQFGLHLRLAQAHLVAGGAGGALDRIAGVRRRPA